MFQGRDTPAVSRAGAAAQEGNGAQHPIGCPGADGVGPADAGGPQAAAGGRRLGLCLLCIFIISNLSMFQHISNTCKAAYIQIRHISSIRHLLTTQATQTLVCSLVLSRLDYCNSLLSGCPQYLLDKLQKVQNAAARLVCKAKKSDHIHPILQTLHWLPVTHRIQYKISTICFNSISGTAPEYLSDLLQPYTPARQLRSASDTRTFVTPRVNTKTFGERSFSYAGPSVWNNLPQTLRHSDSTSSFKAALKMHLFNNYF